MGILKYALPMVIAILHMLFPLVAKSETVVQDWLRTYDSVGVSKNNSARAISADGEGNVYVTGFAYSPQLPNGTYTIDSVTIKYDRNGNEQWIRRYSGLGIGSNYPVAIATDNAGNVFVVAESYRSAGGQYYTDYDYATIKYDSNGNELWVKRYNSPTNLYDSPVGLAVDNFGNAFVTGVSGGNGRATFDCVTVKYDPSGNEVWVKRYAGEGSGEDNPRSIAADSMGNVLVVIHSWGGTGEDIVTVKYDASGNELWVSRYNQSGGATDRPYGLNIDPFNNVIVTGLSFAGGLTNHVTVKYDVDGNLIWAMQELGIQDSVSATDSEGNILIAGVGWTDGVAQPHTIKYDSFGNKLWENYFEVPSFYLSIYPRDTAIDTSGNIYVLGVGIAFQSQWQ